MNKAAQLIKERLPQLQIKEDLSLATCTSFRTGGPADVAAYPETAQDLAALLKVCKGEGIPFYILGNGTNVLAPDEGFRGVIVLTAGMREVSVDAESATAVAGAGVLLSTLAGECAKASLTGLEFAKGIPGSVGGAVVMNAGAYGGEMRDCLVSATVMAADRDAPFEMSRDELDLGYRHSIIPERGLVVLGARFKLTTGDKDSIYAQMEELAGRRRDKQPLEFPSAGSTFKRPEGYFAGKLIEDAGLKGFTVGGAQVSEKHAGFVINKGGATSADILTLIKEVQKRVFENSGVMLETEVKILGNAIT